MKQERDHQQWTRRQLAAAAMIPVTTLLEADARRDRTWRKRPVPADEFVESVGVCVHLASPSYTPMFNEVLRWARNLGVRHFRDDLRPSDDLTRWRTLFDEAGIRAHLLVSPTTNTPDELIEYIRALGPELVSAIEGQNEGDGPWFRSQPGAGSQWSVTVVEYQRAIFNALRQNFPSTSLPVVSPTVLDYQPGDMQVLLDARAYCDIVALHAYVQQNQEPETTSSYAALTWYIEQISDHFKPGAPTMVTEMGYYNGPKGVSQRAMAAYMPRMLLNAFEQGIVRSFVYEMLDEGRNKQDPEQNYGLLLADGTPKPCYHALRILLNELEDPGPSFEPMPLSIHIADAPADLRVSIFAKRGGDYRVAIWRASPIWDQARRRDLPLRPVPIVVRTEPKASEISARPLWLDSQWLKLAALPAYKVVVSEIVTLIRIQL